MTDAQRTAAKQIDECARQFSRLTKRWVLVFSDAESIHLWRQSFQRHGLDHVRHCAWVKPNPMVQVTGDRPGTGMEMINVAHPKGRKKWNGGGTSGVWTDLVESRDRIHPTEKPLGLMRKLVSLFSNRGELIFDPFSGSASTGVAAIGSGRRFVGFEIDPVHFSNAFSRLASAREQAELPLSDPPKTAAKQLALLGGTK